MSNKKRSFAALALGLSLIAAACGSDDKSTTSADTSKTTEPGTPATEPAPDGAFAALRPVTAGHVLVCRQGAPVLIRSGENVVLIHDKKPTRNAPAGFGQPVFGIDLVVSGVQIVDVAGNLQASCIDPWAVADPVACIDRRYAAHGLNAEVGPPSLATGARLRC